LIVAAVIPRFALLIALLAARRPTDRPVALGPQAGAAQIVGLCTPAAEAMGVRPGLRLGEALARCPDLELVVPDPDATAEAGERVLRGLEAIGAAVEPQEPGAACFESRGLLRVHGGLEGVLRRARAALPVGADGRLGVAPSRFAALRAAEAAPSRRPLVVAPEEVAAFLAPLPVERLPLGREALEALEALGLGTMGQVAALPRAAVLDRLGPEGLAAWELARGGHDRPLRPRRPPEPLEAAFRFPEAVGARPALEAAARLLLGELAGRARGRGRALRALTLRARLSDGGSWTRTLTLREATADPERLAAAALPRLGELSAPVEALTIRGDASGWLGGRQLALVETGADERGRRAREAVRQVRAAQGPEAVLRLVELEPWSRLPERRWALAPYDTSPSLDPSA
jgi:protein ImuB